MIGWAVSTSVEYFDELLNKGSNRISKNKTRVQVAKPYIEKTADALHHVSNILMRPWMPWLFTLHFIFWWNRFLKYIYFLIWWLLVTFQSFPRFLSINKNYTTRIIIADEIGPWTPLLCTSHFALIISIEYTSIRIRADAIELMLSIVLRQSDSTD